MARTKQTARKFWTASQCVQHSLCKEHERSGEFEDSIEDRWTWRKENSYSDYSITVVMTKQKQGDGEDEHPQEQEEITYNVHKQNLACGPRRSFYFARLFESGSFSESQDNTSRIELHELAANVFPTFLDYLYSVGRTPELYFTRPLRGAPGYSSAALSDYQGDELLTLHNVTALYFLATYFDVPHLAYHAKKFCFHEMRRADTCGLFYEHATILQAHDILEPVTRLCKLSLSNMSVNSRLMHITDAQFWIDILQDNAENDTFSKYEAYKVSRLIVVFCQNNSTLSLEEFKTLTRDDYLPEGSIHPEAALPLMDLERKIVLEDQGLGDEETIEDESQIDELSNLQKRCVNAILQGCNNKDLEDLRFEYGDKLEYDPKAMLLKQPQKVKQAIPASAVRHAAFTGH